MFGGWSKHLQSCETSALIMMIRRRRRRPHACRLPTPACHRAAQVGVCRVNRRPRSRPPSAPCRCYRGCDVVSCHWLTFSAAGRPAAAAADRRPPAGRWYIPRGAARRGAAGLRLQGTALTQLPTGSSSSSSSGGSGGGGGGGGSQPSQWLEEHSTES